MRAVFQGDIYWVRRGLDALETQFPHPYVVIQEDYLNHSRLSTVVVCALTSNIKRIALPGNVLLDAGEANLPRQSVIEVAKVAAVHKQQLGDYIGTLSQQRMAQVITGLRFIHRSFLMPERADDEPESR